MKRTLFLALFALFISTKGLSEDFFSLADTFFKENVNNGRVAYARIKAQPQQLDALISQIASFDLEKADKATKIALMINAYNILAIKGIIEKYPVKSPMKISNFFDKKVYDVGGKTMSLNQLEKETLFPLANDPRLHFVLVCAAISCPKLANFAYLPDSLGDQIDKTTRENLNDPDFIKVEGEKLHLSEIFNWYSADFKTKGQDVIDFINQYRETKIDTKASIRFYSYNWDINDQI